MTRKPKPSPTIKRPVTVTLTDEERAELDALARRLRVSRGAVVMMMVRAGMAQQKQGELFNER